MTAEEQATYAALWIAIERLGAYVKQVDSSWDKLQETRSPEHFKRFAEATARAALYAEDAAKAIVSDLVQEKPGRLAFEKMFAKIAETVREKCEVAFAADDYENLFYLTDKWKRNAEF